MKYRDAMVAWNLDTDQVRVGPLPAPGVHDWSQHPIHYHRTGGAAYANVRYGEDEATRCLLMFIEFNTLVVRDGVPVEAAHKAFLAIDEYRRLISPDIAGAE